MWTTIKDYANNASTFSIAAGVFGLIVFATGGSMLRTFIVGGIFGALITAEFVKMDRRSRAAERLE